MDRLKKVPLWQWGVIVIMAGMLGSLLVGNFVTPPRGAAEARGFAAGRAAAALLALLVGLVLIALHFRRRS